MDVHEFHKSFIEEVKATAAAEGIGSNAAFVNTVASYLINAEILSDFTPSFYLGTGKNNRKIRVDGYTSTMDEFDKTMNLVIADYSGEEESEVITKTVATSILDRLYFFLVEAMGPRLYKEIEPSTSAADLVDYLRTNKDTIRKYRLILITDGFMSSRISDIESSTFDDVPVEFQIWDIDRLFRVCISEQGKEIEIDFKAITGGDGIPCLEASRANNDDYRSYLCIIPGSVLADIYDRYGSQLLEGNVRSFLSTKVSINKKIRETILRIPENFFAYNNGISATAIDLHIESTPSGKVITYAKDFQIINGGQTTASLSNSRHKDSADLSRIYVQMKLTEVDNNADKSNELIRNISHSSNSQNKVSDADFFATHQFHVEMERISRKLFAPAVGGAQYETKWFYERARGQYLQAQMKMSKTEKAKFLAQNPKKQVITKTDLAKYRNTWAEMPHIVSKGAQTNFMKFADIIDEAWKNSKDSFNDKYFKDTVSLALLFKHTEWIVSNQDWFEQGYRANIVTYSLALLHKMIKSQFNGFDLDLSIIWAKQQVPGLITNELVKITKFVFDTITDPRRSTINVTQWCKREACWDDVKKCNIILSNSITNFLISDKDNKLAEEEAKKDQKFIHDIDVQNEVLKKGADYWKRVNLFISEKGIYMTSDQDKALKIALRNGYPNAFLSKQLIMLLETARSNGFKE